MAAAASVVAAISLVVVQSTKQSARRLRRQEWTRRIGKQSPISKAAAIRTPITTSEHNTKGCFRSTKQNLAGAATSTIRRPTPRQRQLSQQATMLGLKRSLVASRRRPKLT